MGDEKGIGLVELVIVLAVASMLLTAAVTLSLPWLAREAMRGAVYQVQNHLQLARIQAVSRNRSCQFVLDAGAGVVRVVDLNDPADTTDDLMLVELTLPRTVGFSNPEGGPAITLALISGSVYQATFDSDGSVADGAGTIVMTGGDRSDRLTLFGAGGVRVDTWNGSAWNAGA